MTNNNPLHNSENDLFICIKDLNIPKIIVVGGGFAGLALIKGLKKLPVQIVLLDQNNFHQFQPLLYQVATSGLEPDNILFPLRKEIANQHNLEFRLAKAISFDSTLKIVKTDKGQIKYDYLVLATGTTTNFFNLSNIQEKSLPLKSIKDALEIRHTMLRNLELAMTSCEALEIKSLCCFVIVGGGPAGVELAGALAEFKRYIVAKDYNDHISKQMRIILIEASDRLLGTMSANSSNKTLSYLQNMGVEVLLESIVLDYDKEIVCLKKGKSISSNNLIWTAGVKGNILKGINENKIILNNRISISSSFEIEEGTNVFAIGDLSAFVNKKYPKGHPQVAQVAIQQGRFLADVIQKKLVNLPLDEFKYNDKGSMATIGKRRAVAEIGKFKLAGYFAWLLWSVVHLMSIVGFKNKIQVGLNWLISYFNYEKSNRIILREPKRDEPDQKI